jgi:hypothetical protein
MSSEALLGLAGFLNLSALLSAKNASSTVSRMSLEFSTTRNFCCQFLGDKNLYKSCILLVTINSPPNVVRDKGIYSTRAGFILTSTGPAWDLRVQLMEHEEGEDQWVQGWELTGQRSGI